MTGATRGVVRRHRTHIIHREGRTPLCYAGTTLLLGNLVYAKCRGIGRAPLPALLSLAGVSFLAQFFRHPSCSTPVEWGLVVAPASGRIVHVGLEDEPEILGDSRIRVSTFLSVFDAHLTRAPVNGEVVYERYHPGRYLVAMHPKSSLLNERSSMVIRSNEGEPILMRQIAGLLARRICSYTALGQQVQAGEEVGFIKFGSRVDLFLPPTASPLLRVGQAVRGGETPLARLALPRSAPASSSR